MALVYLCYHCLFAGAVSAGAEHTVANLVSKEHLRSLLFLSLSPCRYDDYFDDDDFHSWHGDYDEVHTEHGWEVDSFFRPPRVPEQGHVWLDPHILANPAIADIDGDGQEELVLAVSYFFDRDQYSRPVSSAPTYMYFGGLCSLI